MSQSPTLLPHISVCICTYKRLEFLERLLGELAHQETAGLFSYSIVVADNDQAQSAKPVVAASATAASVGVVYCVQPRRNIALTRNTALEHAQGDFIAFFDDDQYPIPNWLLLLFRTCVAYNVDGVLGPVKPHFEEQPPEWVIKGRFCERQTYPTGFVIDWLKGRTGNVLLKKEVFEGIGQPFDPKFLTGEDQDFFRRAIERGRKFIWCNEAVAYEWTPRARWELRFMLKRALFRGKISVRHSKGRALSIIKSALALPVYCLSLPFLPFFGYHIFVKFLVKCFDHSGKILALLGFGEPKEAYVTE